MTRKLIWSEYGCVDFVCQVATDGFPLPDETGVTQTLRERTRVELERVIQNRLVPFGSKKIRERELVVGRISHDGRLEGLTARGVFTLQKPNTLRVKFDWQPELNGVETVIDFGLALMLDDSRPEFSRIKRCALSSCGRYFVEILVKAGRPSNCCCLDHTEKQRSINSTLRKRKERAKKKK